MLCFILIENEIFVCFAFIVCSVSFLFCVLCTNVFIHNNKFEADIFNECTLKKENNKEKKNYTLSSCDRSRLLVLAVILLDNDKVLELSCIQTRQQWVPIFFCLSFLNTQKNYFSFLIRGFYLMRTSKNSFFYQQVKIGNCDAREREKCCGICSALNLLFIYIYNKKEG